METPNTEAIGPDQITTEDMEKAVDWMESLREIAGKFHNVCIADLALIGATVMVASDLTPELFLEQVKTTYEAIAPMLAEAKPTINDLAQITEAMDSPEIKKYTLKSGQTHFDSEPTAQPEVNIDSKSVWPFPTGYAEKAPEIDIRPRPKLDPATAWPFPIGNHPVKETTEEPAG